MAWTHHLSVICFVLLLSSKQSSSTSSQRCQRISVSRHVVRLQSASPPPFLAQQSSHSPLIFSQNIITTESSSLVDSSPFSPKTVVINDGLVTLNPFLPSPSNKSLGHGSHSKKVLNKPLSSTSEPTRLLSFSPTFSSSESSTTYSSSILPVPSVSSSTLSSSSPSSVCWTSGQRGRTIAFTPDHRGNLWLLTTTLIGSQPTPNTAWVLNFTSMTWNDPGYRSSYEHVPVDIDSESTLSTSSSSAIPSITSSNLEIKKSADSVLSLTSLQPAAFCPWSKGLIAIYTSNGSYYTWFLKYSSGRWEKLNTLARAEHPSNISSVDASWCGRLEDSLWILASNQQAIQKEKTDKSSQEHSDVKGGRYQTLWKLNDKGKWSPLHVRYNKDQSLLSYPSARTWSDNNGGLYLLCENIRSEYSIHVVRFDQTSGTRTIINLDTSPRETFWIPNTTGKLYSLYSDPDGNRVIKTSSYYTGEVISIDSFDTPIRSDILVRINGTIYSNIPLCKADKDIDVPRTVLELHRFFPATGCSNNTSIINYQYNIHEEVTMVRVSKRIVVDTGTDKNTRDSHTRAIFEEAPPVAEVTDNGEKFEGEEAEMVFTISTLSSEVAVDDTGLSRSSSVGGNVIVSDIKEAPPSTRPSGGPHQRDKNHTNDSIVFFSLSLSIFAFVGIVIFVRRCVRCPPAAELGEGGEARGKPPSPLPVLYSIVPDDPAYETNASISPCPSYSAIYEVPTPGEETPNAITPNGGTPNFMTPNMNTPGAETPYSVTPTATTPILASPNTMARHDIMSSREFSNEVTYAVTSSAADAINIATNNVFRSHYINTTQF